MIELLLHMNNHSITGAITVYQINHKMKTIDKKLDRQEVSYCCAIFQMKI